MIDDKPAFYFKCLKYDTDIDFRMYVCLIDFENYNLDPDVYKDYPNYIRYEKFKVSQSYKILSSEKER